MAKFDIGKDVAKQIAKIVTKALNETQKQANLQELGIVLKERIQKRTRRGKGVFENEESEFKLLSLKRTTIAKRTRLRKAGKLSPKTTPRKSNLTATGAMVDSVNSSARRGEITIDVAGREQNKKVTENEKENRVFLRLSRLDLKIGMKFFNGLLKDKFRKI